MSVPPLTSTQLTSINNTVYQAGSLSVWKSSNGTSGTADFTALDVNVPVQVSGDTAYYLGSTLFEVTNVVLNGVPYFYKHQLPMNVTGVTFLDVNQNVVVPSVYLQGNVVYHSLDGSPYYVRYVTADGYQTTTLMRYDPVMTVSQYVAGGANYQLTGRLLTIGETGPHYIRFTALSGYQVMPMYGYLPNTPWYARVRFGNTPPPLDWAQQRFVLPGGILSANYVPGKILNSNLIEFERKNLYYDPNDLPDILVFDKNNVIKYALDGSAPNTAPKKGTLYNWKRGQVQSIDPTNARVSIALPLEPTDVVYGFYSYREPDIVYMDIDVNPFTNPQVKNRIVQFYVKTDGVNPLKDVYYQILDESGSPISGLTNDTSPTTGTSHPFALLVVGATISTSQFSFTDVRQRGGGLAPQYQAIPQATSFFDLGYWDGKPYPIGGTLVVYLPLTILDTLSRGEVQGKVQATIPMGCLAVIRYFDDNGNEYV